MDGPLDEKGKKKRIRGFSFFRATQKTDQNIYNLVPVRAAEKSAKQSSVHLQIE
jgi:hypothetical protein